MGKIWDSETRILLREQTLCCLFPEDKKVQMDRQFYILFANKKPFNQLNALQHSNSHRAQKMFLLFLP